MVNRKLLAVFLCFVWVGCGSEDPGIPCGVDLDCDDGNPCTTDICVSGKCGFKGVFSVPCDDGNACTENTTCNDEGICQGGTEVTFDESPCLICACDPETGVECLPRNVGDPCSDNDCCSTGDFCDACHPDDPGCTAQGIMCVGTLKECSDDNDCTIDTCGCETGEAVCSNPDEPDGLPCVEDENACTEGDFCQGGQCLKGAPLNLDDGNPCTDDYCQKGEVINDPALEGQCDDGNECTEDDFCYLGTCTGGDPVICETAPCSASVECKQGEGCVYSWKPEGAECDDENPCSTTEICNEEHECVGQTFSDCDDFNACTLDACDPNTGGCNNTIITGDCDDGNPCTLTDMCDVSGECLGSKVLCEDDDNPCTLNECNTSDGACGVAVEDGLSCADDALCNGEESCQLGVCTSGSPVVCEDDANPCTEDVCASDSGECNAAVPDDTACDDDDICNGSEICVSGACEAGAAVDCSGVTEPCLENTCNPTTGLCDLNTADDTLCPDGDACNGQETCQGGSCTLGTPVDCPEPGTLCSVSYCDGADGACVTDIIPDCCGNGIVETDEECTEVTLGSCEGSDSTAFTYEYAIPPNFAGDIQFDGANGALNDGVESYYGDALSQVYWLDLWAWWNSSASGSVIVYPSAPLNVSEVSVYVSHGIGGGVTAPNALTVFHRTTASDPWTQVGTSIPAQQIGWTTCPVTMTGVGGELRIDIESGGEHTIISEISISGTCSPETSLVCEEVGEQCDDGNTEDGDFCSSSCQGIQSPDGCEITSGPGQGAGCSGCEEVWEGPMSPEECIATCHADPTCVAFYVSASGSNCQLFIEGPATAGEGACVDPNDCYIAGYCEAPSEIDCAEIHFKDPSLPDGIYTIDPDGEGGDAPFQVYCDMTFYGGGWTLVAMLESGDTTVWAHDSDRWTNASVHNVEALDPGTNTSMKSRAYTSVALDDIRFDMASLGNAHILPWTRTSTQDFFQAPLDTFSTEYGRDAFFSWIPEDSSNWDSQPGCNSIGVNVATSVSGGDCSDYETYVHIPGTTQCGNGFCRYGIIMNDDPDTGPGGCGSTDTAIGFGCKNWSDGPESEGTKVSCGGWTEGGATDLVFPHQGWIWARRAICGNGEVEGSEACDDGNDVNGDGCSTSCQVDALSASTACTNALVENYADHTYVFCPEGRPWETAREICQTIGSHMVKVEESSENDWVYSVALGQPVGVTEGGSSARWIGLNRIEDFDTWVWHDDTAPGFFPQNPASGGDWGDTNRRCAPLLVNAVGASVDGTWMPKQCEISFAYICEFDTVVPPICGNGLTESGESCDDGNTSDGDGCSASCILESFTSCKDILDAQPDATDGVYTIDPDGNGGQVEFDVYCDMTTEGGGWTLISKFSELDGEANWAWDQERYRDSSVLGATTNLNTNDAKSRAYSSVTGEQMLIRDLTGGAYAAHAYTDEAASWASFITSIWDECGYPISTSAIGLVDDGRDSVIGEALYFRHYGIDAGDCTSGERAMFAQQQTQLGYSELGIGISQGPYTDATWGPSGTFDSLVTGSDSFNPGAYAFFVR